MQGHQTAQMFVRGARLCRRRGAWRAGKPWQPGRARGAASAAAGRCPQGPGHCAAPAAAAPAPPGRRCPGLRLGLPRSAGPPAAAGRERTATHAAGSVWLARCACACTAHQCAFGAPCCPQSLSRLWCAATLVQRVRQHNQCSSTNSLACSEAATEAHVDDAVSGHARANQACTEDSTHTSKAGVHQTRSPSRKGRHERSRRLRGTPWRERGTAGQTGAGHGGHGGCRCADNSTGCTLGWGQHCKLEALRLPSFISFQSRVVFKCLEAFCVKMEWTSGATSGATSASMTGRIAH